MDTRKTQSPLVFEFNKAKVVVDEQPSGVKKVNQKKAEQSTEQHMEPKDPWNYPEENKTEVLDDEGHRNTINHY
ncbi:MAG: hypothetical protein ACM3MG_00010 [Bacillota bacterium]